MPCLMELCSGSDHLQLLLWALSHDLVSGFLGGILDAQLSWTVLISTEERQGATSQAVAGFCPTEHKHSFNRSPTSDLMLSPFRGGRQYAAQ